MGWGPSKDTLRTDANEPLTMRMSTAGGAKRATVGLTISMMIRWDGLES
jgi:hypothetical protein